MPMSTIFQTSAARPSQNGVTLIELMIAMVIGLIVTLAMVMLFLNNSQNRRELENSAHMLENGRFALNVLRDEIMHAGFFEALAITPFSPPATAAETNEIACEGDIGEWEDSLGLALMGRNGGGFACATFLPDANENTGMLFVQRLSTELVPASGPGVAFVQISYCNADSDPRIVGGGDSTFNLRNLACDDLAETRRLLRRFYFIQVSNGVPALMRHTRDTGATEPLVEGIEEIQFEFGVDSTGDGAPDSFTDSPISEDDWANIVGVRVWLLARSINRTPGYGSSGPQKVFQVGPKLVDPASDAGYDPDFKREVFTSYIEVHNPAARRQR